ncbi:MAG: Ig-like domain-containing protein [Deltaproteobacteria bacterium]|nr:Ig-like domain-containing protein [Deltaproteobacteria bacterium]
MAALTLVSFVGMSCGPKSSPQNPHPGSGSDGTGGDALIQNSDLPPGLDLRLSNGKAGPAAADRATLAPATKISDADANAVLGRMPALTGNPDDKKDFALRDRSQPPPRPGSTVKGSFPPPPSLNTPPPATNDAGQPLTILRWAPEGDVPVAPQLQITFSQPMIAVTSHDDSTAGGVPVTLSPQPKGHWRWIGTRTLLFDPEIRFPQATTYKVDIAAGVKSVTGNVLKDGKSFTFTTPAPRMIGQWPSGGPTRLDVPMFVLFDQKIDPAAVLATIKVTAAGKTYPVELLDDAAIAKNATLKSLVDSAKANEQAGRWIAFHATQAFPKATDVQVAIGPGTPSAEGPNKTTAEQDFSFETFPPLAIERAECSWGSECPPATPFYVEFNNPLDTDRFDPSQVTVDPAIPGLKVIQNGSYVTLQGNTKAHTTYKVRISGGLLDDFGQTLGKDADLLFKVGAPQPTFYGPSGMTVLDPVAKQPTLDVFSVSYTGLKVKLYQVTPRDYDAWIYFQQHQWDRNKPPAIPGKKVFDQTIKVAGGKDELGETHIDLSPALGKSGLGHAIAIVEPSPWKESWDPPRLYTWVQSTRLALDAFVDDTDLVAWTTTLKEGKALAGVKLELAPNGITATTDDRGTAKIALPGSGKKGANLLIASQGDDTAFVSDDSWSDSGTWVKQSRGEQLAWYVTDDRQMYRPAEEVHLKGWLRINNPGEGGDIAGIAGKVQSVTYEVTDPMGNKMLEGKAKVSALGGWDAAFTLPKTPNLGYAQVHLRAQGRISGEMWHGFQIQEFRRPEFEVASSASQGPHMVGGSADVTVSAKYFAGGGLPGAPVTWNVNASETNYTPPNRDEFVFGTWHPWWGYRAWWDSDFNGGQQKSWSLSGVTDATGAHVLHMDFLSANPSVPMSVSAEASVMDVNRQAWSSSTALIVHPSSLYIGVRAKKPFVEKGQPIELDVIGVDIDGKAAIGRALDVKAVRLDYTYEKGKYVTKELDPQDCAITAAADPVACKFDTKEGGNYQITAVVVDDKGRKNQTQLQVFVTGGDMPPQRDLTQEQVQIIPNAKEYKGGDTAELLVQAPFYPAEGILSVRRSGIVSTERFSLKGPTTTLKIPITDGYVPNVYAQVDLIGSAPRLDDDGQPAANLPRRPAYAVGSINLPVPAKQRTLGVTIAPRAAKVAPGEATQMDVTVVDASGKPVANAEVAVVVVDEAILALTGYQFASPLDAFYGGRDSGGRDYYLHSGVKLARPDAAQLAQNGTGSGYGRGAGGAMGGMVADEAMPTMAAAPPPPPAPPGSPSPQHAERARAKNADKPSDPSSTANTSPIAVRSNFNPLAAFAPEVMTGANGKAVVSVKMPDNLTRYRIVALAVAGERNFGKGESAITARLPLMVRPSPPRFLNFGDTFQFPVVVQNQTDAPMQVKVAVRATNASITDGAGRLVTVPANDRVEVRFPAAAEMAGTARFQIAASSGALGDASELALPVWTPATTEAFATYGVVDSGAVRQPIAMPGSVVTQFGGLEIETSSTQLQALTDAFLYLITYPFECSEQIGSRVMSIAALKDVLDAFQVAGMPKPAAIEARLADDMEHLASMQNYDGGFPIWERGHDSWPFNSVHVLNALVRAKAKGFKVPADMLTRALQYAKTIEQRYPSYYPEDVRRAITSYALYVRKLAGDLDVTRAKGILAEAGGPEKLPMEADGWLLGVMAGSADAATERKAILRHLANKVSETAGAANWTTGYSDGNYLIMHSDRRVDAVILESLIAEAPKDDLIPKVVTGLLAHKVKGRWANTDESVFVLTALDTYFQAYEKVAPDFVAKIWLGGAYVGDHAFKGHTTERFAVDVPMKVVADMKQGDLIIQKAGAKGRLYYRIGMTYAPTSLKLDPADHGFVVDRLYEAVDNPGDVVHQADGTWKIKAGARVRVRLTMVAENRRYHVALVDPLPAGLEPMNPALAVTGTVPQDPKAPRDRYWWWSSTWYEHQNLRDERAEAFTTLLWEGVHEYTYVARATTPGNFVVPPTKAEEMYMPETFGRSASDRVIVE